MKKTILSLLLLVVAATVSAQSLLLGDANQDGQLTVADVTKTANMIVHPEAQGSIDTYVVDNTKVAGTWYMPDATSFALRADGTTTYPGGATYEFMPSQGRLIVYDATGLPITGLGVWKITSEYLLLMDYATGAFLRYTSTEPVVMVSSITLSETSLTMEIDGIKRLTVTVLPANAANRSVMWTSSDESVAEVVSGFVTAIAAGTCVITCTAVDGSGVSATCAVTVSGGSADTHEYVDLGLPSGTLWATMNIGASKPEQYGDYFAWGETSGYNGGKTDFSWGTYKYCKGSSSTLTKYCNDSQYGNNGFTDTKTELDVSDDAAYVQWGSGWRMPSITQFEELINSSYTTTEWTTVNGIYGRKITSKTNANSLFLPAAGYRDGTSISSAGSWGYSWSRTLYANLPYGAYGLLFYNFNVATNSDYRYYGRSVRPVRLSN